MAVNIWRPLDEMVSLRDAMDRLFESSFVRPRSSSAGEERTAAALPVDMYETDEAIVIKARVPGVDPDDIDITATEEAITITGQLSSDATAEEARNWNWLYHELWSGNFSRVLPLRTHVEIDNIEADFEHGLLTLTVPKAEEVKPRSIRIQVKS